MLLFFLEIVNVFFGNYLQLLKRGQLLSFILLYNLLLNLHHL